MKYCVHAVMSARAFYRHCRYIFSYAVSNFTVAFYTETDDNIASSVCWRALR